MENRKLHTTTTTTTQHTSGTTKKLSKVVIIVIIAIVVAIIIVVCLILFFVCRSKRRKPAKINSTGGTSTGAPSGLSSIVSSLTGKPNYSQVTNPGSGQLGPYEPPSGGHLHGQSYSYPAEYPPGGGGYSGDSNTPYDLPYGAPPAVQQQQQQALYGAGAGAPYPQPPRPAGGSNAEYYNAYAMSLPAPGQAPAANPHYK